jgi:hypothetical protein
MPCRRMISGLRRVCVSLIERGVYLENPEVWGVEGT